jgi:hypothetical protein
MGVDRADADPIAFDAAQAAEGIQPPHDMPRAANGRSADHLGEVKEDSIDFASAGAPDPVDKTLTPQPDCAAIRSHVELLHSLAKGTGVDGILCFTRIDASKKVRTERFAIGDVDHMTDAIIGWSTHPDLNLYASYAIFRKDMPTSSPGREADVRAVLALVGDLDSDEGKTGVGLDRLPMEPTYVVETSANNFHAVYPLRKVLSPSDAKVVAVALSNAIGGDSGTKDVSHLWRIPGTLNWPSPKKLGRGRPKTPQLVTVKSAWTREMVDPDALLELVKESKPSHTKSAAGSAGGSSGSSSSAGTTTETFDALPVYLKKLVAGASYPGEDRSRTVSSVIFRLFQRGWSDDAIEALFEAFPNGIGERYAGGKEGKDLRQDIERLLAKFGAEAPPQPAAEPAANPAAILDSIKLDASVDWTEPEGLLSVMADWILLTSRRPNRPMAVAAAVTLLSAVCGRWLYGPTGTALNVYVVILAGTGVGKDRPLAAPGAILQAADLSRLNTSAKGFSVSALEQMMVEHPCCLASVDEIGASLFARIGHKHASTHEQGMRSVLLELWSRDQLKGPFSTTRHAVQKGSPKVPGCVSIPRPNLTLFGASTPESFYSAVTTGSVKDGFLNRFLLCHAAPRGKAQEVSEKDGKVPLDIVKAIRGLVPRDLGLFGHVIAPEGVFSLDAPLDDVVRRLPWTSDDVGRRANELDEQILVAMDGNPETAPLLGRVFEYSVRLASLHAVSRDGRDAKVTMSDLAWGAS